MKPEAYISRLKNKSRYTGKEDDFQKAVAKYLDSLGVLWMHVANEGMHKIQYRAKAKAKGLKPGVPDILIFEPRGDFNGLAIELKAGYGKPSPDQLKWIDGLKNRKWEATWTNSIDECIGIIENYLKNQTI